MNFTIPIYVAKVRPQGSSATIHHCRPLFFDEPCSSDEHLGRALGKMVRQLQRRLDQLGREDRHEQLAAWGFSPDIDQHRLAFTFDLRSGRAQGKFLVVAFRSLDRRVAFAPALRSLWFDVRRGEDLHARAQEVFARHFREIERDGDDAAKLIQRAAFDGQAWVATVDLVAHGRQTAKKGPLRPMAEIFGGSVSDGAGELDRVGRCLDWLYPDDLERAVFRDDEVTRLDKLLHYTDRRPVLLVGPRRVGKTAIVHEYVRRVVEARKTPYADKHAVWLIAPQRLIAGMSFVGQWESRLLAILKHAGRRGHVLYFDDLLGLFHAGVSRDSRLCAADVLKPWIERRQVRVLGELTPEALGVFQERDRAFADMFHIIRVAEPSERDTLRILIAVVRALEERHRSRFELDALPAARELQRRYLRDAAFPGKAAAFLRQLASKRPNQPISRADVYREFQEQTGLAAVLVDRSVRLDRADVLTALGRRVIGQPAALEAMADVVSVAKAQLNDPGRPLGSLLFLGPTGVGKTNAAKALAEYLFGDTERLLRFDMNEFVSPEAAARLVGTFFEPEGLLTAAVRRQPFAVVLLDEIEKAHPDVFDLLLQVLGDGRLTDALGRTTDFSNTIVILTSNLGTREADGAVGFVPAISDAPRFVQAAENFFRPEFFNRLDRIVSFVPLGRGEVHTIAEILIREVLAREGLVRRKCVLQVDTGAMDRVVDQGFHPRLGARALKRAIERQLTQPVATRLAAVRPDAPMLIQLFPANQGIVAHVQEMSDIASDATMTTAAWRKRHPAGNDGSTMTLRAALIGTVESAVSRIEAGAARYRSPGPITPSHVAPQQYRYYLIKEQVHRVRKLCEPLLDAVRRPIRRAGPPQFAPTVRRGRLSIRRTSHGDPGRRVLLEVFSAQDVHAYLRELTATAAWVGDNFDDRLDELLRETALLAAMAQPAPEGEGDQVVLLLDGQTAAAADTEKDMARRYLELFADPLAIESRVLPASGHATPVVALVVSGPHAASVAGAEAGTHLFCPTHENMLPVPVRVLPVPPGAEADEVVSAFVARRREWLAGLAAGSASSDDAPAPLPPVVRIYDERGPTVDLRSGLSTPSLPKVDELRTFLLAGLPLPIEFQVANVNLGHPDFS
jgi:ATP-dependent Clp protease ATP-binding subunit ClpA